MEKSPKAEIDEEIQVEEENEDKTIAERLEKRKRMVV